MFTDKELNSITCLNQAMQYNNFYKASVVYDFCTRNSQNISQCIKIQELYCYLYKHPDLIKNLVTVDEAGLFSIEDFNICINNILQYMCNKNFTPLQAITDYIKLNKSNKDIVKNTVIPESVARNMENFKTELDEELKASLYNPEKILEREIDKIANSLNCMKKASKNGSIHLYKRGSGILSNSPLCVINKKVLTTGALVGVLTVFGTGDVYYVKPDTVNDIISNLKNI